MIRNTPSAIEPIHPAEERLLDAALAQTLPRLGHCDSRAKRRRLPGHDQLLVAALGLLGMCVTTAQWWIAPTHSARGLREATMQDPVLAGRPAIAWNAAELRELPEQTEELTCMLTSWQDLALLTRLPRLRRVELQHARPIEEEIAGPDADPVWTSPDAAVFAPLAQLPSLTTIVLRLDPQLTAAHVAALGAVTKLETLDLRGTSFVIDETCVTELGKLPGLRRLRLQQATADAATLRRLRDLPLTSLQLDHCAAFDADAFAELCRFDQLHELELCGLGRPPLLTDVGPLSWAPAPEQWQRLAGMTALASLTLDGCTLGGDGLRALPATLAALRLTGHELEAADILHLKRFGALRDLEFSVHRFTSDPTRRLGDTSAEADALSAAIDALRLRVLSYEGTTTTALLRSIASQPDLEQLTLRSLDLSELGPLAFARALRELRLEECHPMSDAQNLTAGSLRPLTACRSLRRLSLLTANGLDAEQLRELLAPEVVVQNDSFSLGFGDGR